MSKAKTSKRQVRKITKLKKEKVTNEFLKSHLIELSQIVRGLQISQEAMLGALITKGVLTPEDFGEAVTAFQEKIKEAEAKMKGAKKAAAVAENTPEEEMPAAANE